jgi:hypothetical protein
VAIQDEVTRIKNAVDQICSAFQALHIPSEDLDPGECEPGILIPRQAVNNKLVPFAKKLQEINFIVTTFSELATGATDDFEIRTISSTDLTVYLQIGLKTAAVLGRAIAWIVNQYKSILEIRKNHAELQKQGVPDKLLKGIEDHANHKMDEGMDSMVAEIVKTYCATADTERKHELSNGIRISFNKIANRIDRGFNFELRVQPLKPGGPPRLQNEVDSELLDNMASIQATSQVLEFMNIDHTPILKLPEATTELKRQGQQPPRKTRQRASRVKKNEDK